MKEGWLCVCVSFYSEDEEESSVVGSRFGLSFHKERNGPAGRPGCCLPPPTNYSCLQWEFNVGGGDKKIKTVFPMATIKFSPTHSYW